MKKTEYFLSLIQFIAINRNIGFQDSKFKRCFYIFLKSFIRKKISFLKGYIFIYNTKRQQILHDNLFTFYRTEELHRWHHCTE